MDTRIPPEDRTFAELVLEQGLASRSQVDECLRHLALLVEQGVTPLPRLRALLAHKGYIAADLFGDTVRLGAKPPSSGTIPAPAVEASRDPSNQIGKYVRVSRLGAGGMGEVWRAWDPELNRWVALKFLKGDDPDELARFRREAQTAAALVHPNISAVYDVGEHAGKPFIAMQLVDGQTLQTFPRQDHPLIAELVRDAALAVHAAHEKGVIHRDLKPANIMVEGKPPDRGKTSRRAPGEKRASSLRLYVMDFGLAKTMDVRSDLSLSGCAVGTPGYMSPEQIRGQREIDGRSDVYSLGATLYELLAGRTPFVESNVYDLLRKALDEDPGPIRKINPRVDPDLETIAMRCLEKEPDRRYASAQQLAEDLTRWLDGEPILAHPPSMLYRFRRKILRQRSLAFAVGVALALAIGFAVYAVVAGIGHERLEEEARRSEARREATVVYKDADAELRVLRLRSYRAGWKLTDEEFEEYQRIIERCRAELERSGDDADGLAVVGLAHQILGDWDAAVDAYDRGLRADGDHPACLLRKARLLTFEAVVGSLKHSPTKRQQRDSEARMKEALSLLERGTASGRIDSIEHDIAQGYGYVLRRESAAGHCEAMLQKWKDKDFWEEFYLIRGIADGDSIIADATEALRLRPGHYAALFWRGIAHRMRGAHHKAVADFSRALELNPRFALAAHERGFARHKSMDHAGAVTDFTESLRIRPDQFGSLVYRAQSLKKLRKFAEALKDLDRALELRPDHTGARLERGSVKYMMKDLAGARADAEGVIRRDESIADAWYLRGVTRGRLGDAAGAFTDLAKALELDPQHGTAYSARATFRMAGEDPTGAISDLGKAIESDPGNAMFYVNRAGFLARLGRLDDAIADGTRAIDLAPDNLQAYNNRGLARLGRRDFAGAISDFDEMIRLQPKSTRAWTQRGMARLAAGDESAARKDLEHALTLGQPAPMTLYSLACLEKNAERAFGLLNRAIAAGFRDRVRLEQEPRLRRLHDDPRWPKLVNRVPR